MLRSFQWAGLKFDEGPSHIGGSYGPYIQSQRTLLYKSHADHLLDHGHAYRCFCTPTRLDSIRAYQKRQGRAYAYDGHCRNLSQVDIERRLSEGQAYAVRLKAPREGVTTFRDLVKGEIKFRNQMVDDQILLKSDGFPTYHLANVVDDHLMAITHVVRGEEWIPSTPKHVLLYRYFQWKQPEFAHLPLLLNPDGSKLSKRQGDVNVEAYIQQGYFPEALINFIAYLGWTPEQSESNMDLMTLSDLERVFSWGGLNKTGAVVRREKLDYFNKAHLQRLAGTDMSRLVNELRQTVQTDCDDAYLTHCIDLLKGRVSRLAEIAVTGDYLFRPLPDYETELARELERKMDLSESQLTDLIGYAYEFAPIQGGHGDVSAWKQYMNTMSEYGKERGIPSKKVKMALRYAVTARPVGAGLPETMNLLGYATVRNRLSHILKKSKQPKQATAP